MSIEVFTVSNPRTLFARPLPIIPVARLKKVSHEKTMAIARINDINDLVQSVHRKIGGSEKGMRINSRQGENAKISIVPYSLPIRNYVIMHND